MNPVGKIIFSLRMDSYKRPCEITFTHFIVTKDCPKTYKAISVSNDKKGTGYEEQIKKAWFNCVHKEGWGRSFCFEEDLDKSIMAMVVYYSVRSQQEWDYLQFKAKEEQQKIFDYVHMDQEDIRTKALFESKRIIVPELKPDYYEEDTDEDD